MEEVTISCDPGDKAVGTTDAGAVQPVDKAQDDPSAGHSPMCKALWKALSGSGPEAWQVLDVSGFNSALVEAVSSALPVVAIEKTPVGFYRLCALPTVPAYAMLSHMQAALAGWKSAAETLRHLAEPARNTVLRMCMTAVERCIQEESDQPNLGEETLPTGLPVAVDTALPDRRRLAGL